TTGGDGMTTPSDSLSGPWTAYRSWAETARYHKEAIDRLTRWSLWLGIGGALLAPARGPGEGVGGGAVARGRGGNGVGAIALAAYLSQQAQANDRETVWTRSRSAAESLKSCIILYRAAAPPFDGPDRATQIRSQTEKVREQMSGIEPRPPGPESPPEL